MKKLIVFFLFILSLQNAGAQASENTDEFDELAMIEKVKDQANKAGYTEVFRIPGDTSRTFVAEVGHSYRLVLIFRENIEKPGRRLVVYQRDSSQQLKRLYMAQKDQHIKRLNGHMIVTEVPAVMEGESFIYMNIDALPTESKLFIFRK